MASKRRNLATKSKDKASPSAAEERDSPYFVAFARESHGKPLYSVAFLDQAYRDAAQEVFSDLGAAMSAKARAASASGPDRGMSPVLFPQDLSEGQIALGASLDDKDATSYFATAGGRSLTVYAMHRNGFEPVQSYLDDDAAEDFYAVRWSIDSACGAPLIAVAGVCGPIKVINSVHFRVHCVLKGHGDAVNDLRFHPTDPSLLLSASKDESLRLWNIQAECTVMMFGGDKGHASDVLAADFHCLGGCFASAGMDNTIKVWSLDDPQSIKAIAESYDYASLPSEGRAPFRARLVQCPAYSTDGVHSDYVDSCAFFGNLLLSKSTDSRLFLWNPDVSARLRLLLALRREDDELLCRTTLATDLSESELLRVSDEWHDEKAGTLLAGECGESEGLMQDDEEHEEGAATVVAELPLQYASLWFTRFSVDEHYSRIAAGNDVGQVFVFEPGRPGALMQPTERDALVHVVTPEAPEVHFPLPTQEPVGSQPPSNSSLPATNDSGGDVALRVPDSLDELSAQEHDRAVAYLAATPLKANPDMVKRLFHRKCHKPVRQTAFSPDGTSVIAVCDDATVWRYDLTI
jgi:WD40 repeat protein